MPLLTRGERFKDARTVHNQHGKQTLREVKNATGVNESLIQALEDDNSTRSVGYDKVAALAKHYGVSVDWLCSISDDPLRSPGAVDELGLSPKAVANLKSYCSREDAAGFIDGINMILTSPRIFTLAKDIDLLARNITLEKSRLKQFERDSEVDIDRLFSVAKQMDKQDIDVSAKLADLIAKEFPEYKGRVAVSCGRVVLQSQMQDIVGMFRDDMQVVTGYLDCFLDPLNEI